MSATEMVPLDADIENGAKGKSGVVNGSIRMQGKDTLGSLRDTIKGRVDQHRLVLDSRKEELAAFASDHVAIGKNKREALKKARAYGHSLRSQTVNEAGETVPYPKRVPLHRMKDFGSGIHAYFVVLRSMAVGLVLFGLFMLPSVVENVMAQNTDLFMVRTSNVSRRDPSWLYVAGESLGMLAFVAVMVRATVTVNISDAKIDLITTSASDYAVMVSNLPRVSKAKRYVEHFGQFGPVRHISVVYSEVDKWEMWVRRRAILERVQYSKLEEMTGETAFGAGFGGPKTQALLTKLGMGRSHKWWLKRQQRLNLRIQREEERRSKSGERRPARLFVTFDTKAAQTACLDAYGWSLGERLGRFFSVPWVKQSPRFHFDAASAKQRRKGKRKVKEHRFWVDSANNPDEIIWENLATRWQERAGRRVLSVLITLVAISVAVFMIRTLKIVGGSFIDSAPGPVRWVNDTVEELTSGSLRLSAKIIPVIVVIIASTFKVLATKLSYYEKHLDKARRESSDMWKRYLIGASLYTLGEYYVTCPGGAATGSFLNRLSALSNSCNMLTTEREARFAEGGDRARKITINNFYQNLLIVIIVDTMKANLTRVAPIGDLVKRFAKGRRALSQKEMNTYFTPPEFSLAERTSSMSALVTLTFFWGYRFPLLFMALAIAFIINYAADKFFILRVAKDPPNFKTTLVKPMIAVAWISLALHVVRWILVNYDDDAELGGGLEDRFAFERIVTDAALQWSALFWLPFILIVWAVTRVLVQRRVQKMEEDTAGQAYGEVADIIGMYKPPSVELLGSERMLGNVWTNLDSGSSGAMLKTPDATPTGTMSGATATDAGIDMDAVALVAVTETAGLIDEAAVAAEEPAAAAEEPAGAGAAEEPTGAAAEEPAGAAAEEPVAADDEEPAAAAE